MHNTLNINLIEILAKFEYHKNLEELNTQELHGVITKFIMCEINDEWKNSKENHQLNRCAYYFSAEFLVGRAIFNNMLCLKKYNEIEDFLKQHNQSLCELEDIEDDALGNGGLGRLAACFLDAGATLNLPLDGYGIRYKYGIFKQSIEDGFQTEYADDWTRYGDNWSVRKSNDSVVVKFADMTINAVPYDMPIVGFNTPHISTLRLWQSEPIECFNFEEFNNQNYDKAVIMKNRAEDISRVLYPNDSTEEGKILRLRQQYFFCSASLQDIIKNYKKHHGNDFSKFYELNVIQLNDTHPVCAIPELMRLLIQNEGLSFDDAFNIVKNSFCYTNHTVMQEALEKWDTSIMQKILPDILDIIKRINDIFKEELNGRLVPQDVQNKIMIIQNTTIHMAYLAVYCAIYVNGVAEIHTEILKDEVLSDLYKIYPEKFKNVTNGITPRRWIYLANPELSKLITELLGTEDWVTNLPLLEGLEKFEDDKQILERFSNIKYDCKKRLCDYINKHENVTLNADTIFDVQIKRIHEYKRQFLNILTILYLYYEIKDGSIQDYYPTTFIFGGKSAPGYARAKGIIKLINEVSKLIENDETVSKYLKVLFIHNYNVSYAEKIFPASDVSEQISTAGTEASGTGNMKFMLNGAVTFGTYDGANIEIVQEAGEQNNYIFGARLEDIENVKDTYCPKDIYNSNPKIKRVLDSLIDGTLDDGNTDIFKELYTSILEGSHWHTPDHYFLLLDFDSCIQERLKLNQDYKNKEEFAKKCWINISHAGKFSADRSINDYANNIWHISPCNMN